MCRETLCKRINEKSLVVSAAIRQALNESVSVCTTADIWSCLKKSYMGVTAHFISEQMTRVSVALACKRFKGAHTYDAIAEMLVNIHADFGLDNKKVAFTVTDNGSNFVKAFTEFQDELSLVNDNNEELEEDDDEVESIYIDDILSDQTTSTTDAYLPKHMRCASHTLNLVATTDVKNAVANDTGTFKRLYGSTTAKCSRLWTNVSRSSKASDIVESIIPVSLRAPGETRWNSTYDAIKRLLEVRVREKLPQLMDALKIPRFKSQEMELLQVKY